jgi:hypothetical protein
MMYRRVQTGENTAFGGVKNGLLIVTYQSEIESITARLDKKPTRRQVITAIPILR